MTTSTDQLAHQFAKLNEDFSSFWATRKRDGTFDMLHPVSGTTFQNQCAELVQEALQIAATPSETFKAIATHNATIPGAAEGFAAAYGMSCASDRQRMKLLWEGISEIAKNLGVSLVTEYFRRGFWAVPNYSHLNIKQTQWGDATLGCLVLNGAKYLQSCKDSDLGNNVPGIAQYFQLVKGDPNCREEWSNAEKACLDLIERDILPLSYQPAREIRRLVLGDRLVTGRECSEVAADLIGYIASDSYSVEDLAERLSVLACHPSYLKNGFAVDFRVAQARGAASDNYGEEAEVSNDDCDVTPLFRAKLNRFYDTLCNYHPEPDIVIASWVFGKPIGDCYDIREAYQDDSLWLQKNLILRIESDQKQNVFDNSHLRLEVFLEALLERLTPDEVLEICGHSDKARALGFKVNADTRLLQNVQDEKILTSALEYSLGI